MNMHNYKKPKITTLDSNEILEYIGPTQTAYVEIHYLQTEPISYLQNQQSLPDAQEIVTAKIEDDEIIIV